MERYININGLRCHYKVNGFGESIILIHGWGQSVSFWAPLDAYLSTKYKIYNIDLPGFGKSSEPKTRWNISDYAKFINDFTKRLLIKDPILIGHSFGGRIAAVYAASYKCKELVLYSSSGIPMFSFSKSLFKLFNLILKPLIPNMLYQLHCTIYKPASYMNQIIVKQSRSKRMIDIYLNLEDDLRYYFKNIKIPSILIYGDKDKIVSLKVGKTIHKIVHASEFFLIKNSSHFSHLEQTTIFENKLIDWLKS